VLGEPPQIAKGNIALTYTPTQQMPANPLTKPATAIVLRNFNERINPISESVEMKQLIHHTRAQVIAKITSHAPP